MDKTTNGHDRKRAVLYTRVSTREQAEHGYSLRQQLEALREYASREGYEVLEEVEDAGISGVSLERPGLDRVRALVASGGVSVVLAQDRDRFAREPAYTYLLRREFEEHGCKLRALNDRGDDSPEGELMDSVFDQFAKYERAKTAERTRRGKLKKAKEGKILPTGSPPFGFSYNEDRDGYVVDEGAMRIVRRVFETVAEGGSLWGMKKALDAEGILTPQGKRYWDLHYLRTMIDEDVYKAHTYEEIAEMVSPDVAARLDRDKRYGVWWFNRNRYIQTHGGKKKKHVTPKPRSEWVAVPVPDAGISREVVDTARERVKGRSRFSKAGDRFWELAGGILFCGSCGRRMLSRSSTDRNGKRYYYYVCPRFANNGNGACANNKYHRAQEVEEAVARFVGGELLMSRERLEAHIDEAIEKETAGLHTPEVTAEAYHKQIEGCVHKREKYQEMYAADAMTLDELKSKLAELDEVRVAAEVELERLREGQGRVEELKEHKRALLEVYGYGLVLGFFQFPAHLRQFVYELLGLRVTVYPEYPWGRGWRPAMTIEGDFSASVIRSTHEVEEFARELKEIERQWEEEPASEDDDEEFPNFLERKLNALRSSYSQERNGTTTSVP